MKSSLFDINTPLKESIFQGFIGFRSPTLFKSSSYQELLKLGYTNPKEFFASNKGLLYINPYELLYIAVASNEAVEEVFKHPEYMEKIEKCHIQVEFSDPNVHKTARCEDQYLDYKAKILHLDRSSLLVEVP